MAQHIYVLLVPQLVSTACFLCNLSLSCHNICNVHPCCLLAFSKMWCWIFATAAAFNFLKTEPTWKTSNGCCYAVLYTPNLLTKALVSFYRRWKLGAGLHSWRRNRSEVGILPWGSQTHGLTTVSRLLASEPIKPLLIQESAINSY